MKRLAAMLLTVSILGGFSVAQFAAVGTLDFPPSGSPEAQRYFLRGVAQQQAGDLDKAVESIEKSLALAPDGPNARNAHAQLLQCISIVPEDRC